MFSQAFGYGNAGPSVRAFMAAPANFAPRPVAQRGPA